MHRQALAQGLRPDRRLVPDLVFLFAVIRQQLIADEVGQFVGVRLVRFVLDPLPLVTASNPALITAPSASSTRRWRHMIAASSATRCASVAPLG